jgi:hypothetical protein
MGEGSASGVPWGEGLGKGGWKERSEVCDTRRCAHVADEPTRDGVGLGNPIERCLASRGRGNRRWDGGQLAMTQDARDDRLLGHGGNNAGEPHRHKGQVAISRANTRPRSLAQDPERCASLRLLPVHTLLARCGMIASRSLLCGAKQPA